MIGHSHFHVVMIAEDGCLVGEGLKRTREEDNDEEERSGGPMFDPPVYKQRYTAVLELARREEPKTVVDMGCGECKLVRQLKSEHYIEQLYGVDIERSILEESQYWIKPLITDFIHRRPHPLHACLMQGSICNPDARIQGCDLLACIEVIEHLYPDTLAKVPHALFQAIRPKVAIVSTPNADFNVLFGPHFKGFRHYDHKFEWTRRQFQTWCLQVCVAYGYSVEFTGVGDPPSFSDMVLGHCSQIAVFRLLNMTTRSRVELGKPFKIIAECDHPYDENPLTTSEKLCREAEYYFGVLLKRKLAEEEDAEDMVEHVAESNQISINLEDLLFFPQIKKLCSSIQDIRSALSAHSSMELSADGCSVLLDVCQLSCEYTSNSSASSCDESDCEDCHCVDGGCHGDTSQAAECTLKSLSLASKFLPTESWD